MMHVRLVLGLLCRCGATGRRVQLKPGWETLRVQVSPPARSRRNPIGRGGATGRKDWHQVPRFGSESACPNLSFLVTRARESRRCGINMRTLANRDFVLRSLTQDKVSHFVTSMYEVPYFVTRGSKESAAVRGDGSCQSVYWAKTCCTRARARGPHVYPQGTHTPRSAVPAAGR